MRASHCSLRRICAQVMQELRAVPDAALIHALQAQLAAMKKQLALEDVSSCLWYVSALNLEGATEEVYAAYGELLAVVLTNATSALLKNPGMPHEQFASIVAALGKNGCMPAHEPPFPA